MINLSFFFVLDTKKKEAKKKNQDKRKLTRKLNLSFNGVQNELDALGIRGQET